MLLFLLAFLRLGFRQKLHSLASTVRQRSLQFNLYSETEPNIRLGIIASRIYILLMIMTVVVMAIYTSIEQHSQTVTISNPTLSQFEEVNFGDQSMRSCPCQRVAMTHSRIITLRVYYHQICSSVFVMKIDGFSIGR